MTLIAGDYDMNLLIKIISDKRLVIFDFMLANSFFPKIILLTILDRNSRTLIANIYFKLSPLFIDAILGIICSKMSDHFPYFLSLKVISNDNKIAIRKSLDQKDSDTHALLERLRAANLYELLDGNPYSDRNLYCNKPDACIIE